MWTQLASFACSRRAIAACAGLTVASVLAPSGAGADASSLRTPALSGLGYVAQTKGGHIALSMSADARQVRRAHVAYTYTCDDGTGFTDFEAFRAIPLSRTGAFSSAYDSGAFPTPLLAGVTSRVTGSIDGRRNRLRTKVTGTARFTVVTTIVATGKFITCDTGQIRYTAKD